MSIIFKPERYLLNKQIKNFSSYMKGDILDVGSGKSDRYSRLFKPNKYVRLDIDPSCKPDIVADAQNIPLPDGSFDSIISTQGLEHIPNPSKAILEFYRVLKKNGYCLITVPFFNELHEEPHDYWRFTKYSLEMMFKETGFKIISIEQRGGFFSVLAQLFTRYLINRFSLFSSGFGMVANPFLKVFGLTMIWLDKVDKSRSNRKFSIGWIAVVQKIK